MRTDISFEAHDKALSEVLFGRRKYRVPRYQRPYAWSVDQVSEFLEDLINNDEPYFLGSFIFNTEQEKSDSYVDIIDGQQRLLTITLLVAVLRDLARPIDADKAKLYQRQDIAIEDRDGGESFRLLPADTLSEYFLQYVQAGDEDILKSSPSTPEEVRVKENYAYLYSRVSAELKRLASPDAQLDRLNSLRKKVSDLVVISVEIAREEDAYEIFETTNARGLELSVGDLLKNLIFKRIPASQDRDFAKEVWQQITDDVESTNTELRKFIRYFWISKYAFVPEKRLYREIKRTIEDWQKLLTDLWDNSRWYNRLLEGNEEDFQDIKHGYKIYSAVRALRLMRVSQCHVLLLSILRNMDRLGTDPTRIIQFVEKFSFQYSAVGKQPGNRVEKIYSKFALKIEEAANQWPDKHVPSKVQSIFSELEKELRAGAPSEQLFKASFAEISYRNSEESRLMVKYILARVDAHLGKTGEQQIDFNSVNIEHVLPQNPNKDWKLSKKDIKGYVNRLGNLTLISKKINSRVQNIGITDKLPELASSRLPINEHLVDRVNAAGGKWGEGEIVNRQDVLADMAYKHIWPCS